MEIIVKAYGVNNDTGQVITILHHDGSEYSQIVLDTFGDYKIGGDSYVPVVADIDNDGRYEIILTAEAGGYRMVFVVRDNGFLLPGWPKILDGWAGGTVSVFDVDNDGYLEIFVVADKFYAWKHDGTELPGWPIDYGWWLLPGQGPAISPPSFGDIDGDGDVEIVFGASVESDKAYAFHADGTPVSGWPITLPRKGGMRESPVIGDVDGNGTNEVVGFQLGSHAGAGLSNMLYVWEGTGQPLAGWPYLFPLEYGILTYSSPVLADLDGDGSLEIIKGYGDISAVDPGDDYGIIVFNADGTVREGWPVKDDIGPGPDSVLTQNMEGVVVADIDGDGNQEIIARGPRGIYAFKPDGSPVYGFPRPGPVPRGISIGDIDGKGSLEIVYTDSRSVHILTGFASAVDARIEWGQYKHDNWATGLHGFVPKLPPDTRPWDTTPPSVPTNLVASNITSNSMLISWSASTDNVGVAGYWVFRNRTEVARVTSGTSYQDAGLDSYTTFTYAVSAYDQAGNSSAQSASLNAATLDGTPPTVPTDLQASGITSNSVTLSWSASTDNMVVAGYRVYRNGTQVATVTLGTSYQDTNLTPNATYSYTVSAYDWAGNSSAQSSPVSATTLPPPETTPPSVPTNLVASGITSTSMLISWSASTDNVGVVGYRVYRNGTQVATVTSGTSYQNTSLTPNTTYTYTVSAYDQAGNSSAQSSPVNATTLPPPVQNIYQVSCSDGGIQCVERVDGGNDSNNVVNGQPKVDVEYEFRVIVKDTGGFTPQYVRLFMTQRNNPVAADFYAYDMACTGSYATGATCTYPTTLGPAAVHKFYFQAKMSDGTTKRFPDTGYITGPVIQLLTGYNLVGISRDIKNASLDGNTAFGSTRTYGWDARGYYTKVTNADPVMAGEGYFVFKAANTLAEHGTYNDIQDSEYSYQLVPGWNIISNPYAGNVKLSDIRVKKGNDTPVSWTQAVTNGWLVNAIYSYDGSDWGKTYKFKTSDDGAKLVPWMGCWIRLNQADDTYSIVFSKPAK